MSFFYTLHKDYSVFKQARQLPYITWSKVWGARVESLNVDVMLVHSCGPMVVEWIKSSIEHQRRGIGCSARV